MDRRGRFVTLWLRLGSIGFAGRFNSVNFASSLSPNSAQHGAELNICRFPHLAANLLHQFDLPLLGGSGLPRV